MVLQHQHAGAECHQRHLDSDQRSGHQRRQLLGFDHQYGRRRDERERNADGPVAAGDHSPAHEHDRDPGQQCGVQRGQYRVSPARLSMVFQHEHPDRRCNGCDQPCGEYAAHECGRLLRGHYECGRERDECVRNPDGPFARCHYRSADECDGRAGEQCGICRDEHRQHTQDLPMVFQHQHPAVECHQCFPHVDQPSNHECRIVLGSGEQSFRGRDQLQRHLDRAIVSGDHYGPAGQCRCGPGQQRRVCRHHHR